MYEEVQENFDNNIEVMIKEAWADLLHAEPAEGLIQDLIESCDAYKMEESLQNAFKHNKINGLIRLMQDQLMMDLDLVSELEAVMLEEAKESRDPYEERRAIRQAANRYRPTKHSVPYEDWKTGVDRDGRYLEYF
jgi:hypothetical protein